MINAKIYRDTADDLLFNKGDIVVLADDWTEINTRVSKYTNQIGSFPDREYTVRRDVYIDNEWIFLEWLDADTHKGYGGIRKDTFEPRHFTLKQEVKK